MTGLTAKQKAVLDCIQLHYSEHGKCPTVREIARRIGVNSSCTVQRHLEALVRKGALRTDGVYKYRRYHPVEGALPYCELRQRLEHLEEAARNVLSCDCPECRGVLRALLERKPEVTA